MYIDTIFVFYGYILIYIYIYTHIHSLFGCMSMTVWTHAVLDDLYMYVFCIFVFFALVRQN